MSTTAARALIWQLLGGISTGSLVVCEAGARRTFGRGTPTATVTVHSPQVWRMLLSGSRGLADAYAQGLWDSPDPVALIRVAARNAHRLDRLRRVLAPALVPWQRARAVLSPSTRHRSRRDIAAHYDLGNQLFARMLDSTMSYSCALFEHEGMTLEQASLVKLERICQQLELQAGDRVLEIGGGWGGFAVHAATTRGCHVTTTTISREQYDYVREQVRGLGLADLVSVVMHDYRDLRGRYDKLVSIEMIEAVGWQHFGTYLSQCSRLLTDDGAMLLQAITIDDQAYEVEKAARSFINTRVFPGGCLPSLSVLMRELSRRTDLHLVAMSDLTPHYVTTLRRWRENFLAGWDSLAPLGYDEPFRRTWLLYLDYCEAGFAERRIADVQLLLGKPGWRPAQTRLTAADCSDHSENDISPQSWRL